VGDLRYADAGVDIDEGNRAVALIKRTVASTFTSGVLGGLGSFSGLFQIDTGRHRQPVLVASADGVGTKIKVAIATGRHRGIGTDLVNHCVNDILCCGADPLFFLDYFATGRLHPEQLAEIVEGIAVACSDAGCALIGGETAEMPGIYALADYDLAGFIVGIVERDGIIDGARVRAGDAVLGLPSSGLHTNGYSLVRHIVSENELDYLQPLPGTDRPLAELLLEPHRSYLHAVRELRGRVDVRALAHVTGGGLKENVPRALPQGLGVELDRDAWPVPPIFEAIQRAGGVHPDEMWRTFNMGIGMAVVVPADQAGSVAEAAGVPVLHIGRVVEQSAPERVVLR
jgi:phosphoribosylformylglycinamidine cyclo-ligase